MKRAFSIVELLVVLAILAVLLGVLLPTLNSATESARAAKCLANLHNLAIAWVGAPASSIEIPLGEYFDSNDEPYEFNMPQTGWVSGQTQGLYSWIDGKWGRKVQDGEETEIDPISMYETNYENAKYAITNGWYYLRTKAAAEAYLCPTHVKKLGSSARPLWTYLMNVYIDELPWKDRKGSLPSDNPKRPNPDVLLLFAEVPFQGPGSWFPLKGGSPTDTDGVLQYDGFDTSGVAENVGGNHRSGKSWYAHVAFVDGHVEKLNVTGLDSSALKELTKWLCTGTAVGRNEGRYEEIKQED